MLGARTLGQTTDMTWGFRVGRAGLEPTTPCVSCKCATNCANGPWRPTIPPTSSVTIAPELDRAETDRPLPYGTVEVTAGVVRSIAPQPLNCRCLSSWTS